MTGTDPAIEAARWVRRRYLESIGIADVKPGYEGATPEEIVAAREALAPVRDLHRRSPIYVWSEDCEDPGHDDYIETSVGEYVCPECPPVGWTCRSRLRCR